MKNILYLLLIASLSTSCIGPAELDLQEVDPQIVIDAIIETSDSIHYISISRSTSIAESGTSVSFEPVDGALVELVRGDGRIFVFTAETPGNYVGPEDFSPCAGESYALIVTLGDSQLITEQQEILETPDIEDVYFEANQELSVRGDQIVDSPVMSFSVDLQQESRYMRYDYEMVYEVFRQRGPGECGLDYEPPLVCYKTEKSSKFINVVDYESLDLDRSEPYQVVDIDPDRRLEGRFSILIKQKSVNENVYQYWSDLKNQLENNGGLFDPIPGPVEGNIYYLDNPDRRALGVFEITAPAGRREFVLPSSIREPLAHFSCTCVVNIIPEYGCAPPGSNPMWPTSCCDCRLLGDTEQEKPEFWP